jgi:hypothetical protein
MTTKPESNEQMNALIRRVPQRRRLQLVSENGHTRIVATEPAGTDATKSDDANSKGARNEDN